MIIHEHLERYILLLTVSPIVSQFQVVKRRETDTDGYLRVRAILTDEGLLEISLYCQLTWDNVHVTGYRFHWQDKGGKLIKRWDDARHHPELRSFPYHMHVSKEENVKESMKITLEEVLRALESEMGNA